MSGEKGGAKLIALAVVSTVVVAGGALGFFLIHPAGREAFRSFLYRVSGKPLEAPETPEETKGEAPDPQPPETRELSAEVVAALARAREALDARDFDAAEAATRKALALDPGCTEAKELLKTISAKRAGAEELRRKIAHDEALRAAEEFLDEGDLDRAAARVEKALAEIPGSAEAMALRDRIAAERKRIADEAARKRSRADDIAREGNAALQAGDFERALEFASQALEIDPDNVAAENLRSQAELGKKRAAKAAAEPPSPIELEGAAEPAAAGPSREVKVITLEEPDVGPIEIPAGPVRLPAGPVELEGAAEGAGAAEAVAPVEIAAPPRPAAKEVVNDAPAGPVSVDIARASEPAGPVSLELDSGQPPSTARAVLAALAELDRAMQSEDAGALERLLSERAGGILTGGSATRAEEIENARAFFEVASDIRVERTTKPEDIRIDAYGVEARSSFRISYRIKNPTGVAQISRGYRALYRVAKERGAWRIAKVVVEEERP